MSPANRGFGARLRDVRAVLGMNQTDFTKLARIKTQGTVSDWETEKTVPPDGALRLISDRFSQSEAVFQWLLKGGKRPALQRRPFAAEGDRANHKYQGLLVRFEALVREMPLVVFELDQEDKIVTYHAGRATEDLWLSPEEFYGRRLWEVMPLLPAEKYREAVKSVRGREQAVGSVGEYDLMVQDGSRQYVASLVLLPDNHVWVCVRRAGNSRKHELGIVKGRES